MQFLTDEFAHYLQEHQHPWNRATHMVGIPIIVLTPLIALALLDWRWLVGGQVVGWAFQLLGHRFEGNRPALVKRPISVLMGPLMVGVEYLELVGFRFAFAKAAREQVGLS
jgi:uncharacterized membrane protein YGL010W